MMTMCSVKCTSTAALAKVRGSNLFCLRCGCYSEKKVRGLAANCRGSAKPTAALKRLRSGRPPLSGEVMPEVLPPQVCSLVARRRRIQWKRPACRCWLCAMGRAAPTGAVEDQVSLLLR